MGVLDGQATAHDRWRPRPGRRVPGRNLTPNPAGRLLWSLLGLALSVVVVAGVLVGAVPLSPAQVGHVLLDRLTGAGPVDQLADRIVLQVRLPRVVTAVVAGAALAATGVVIQAVIRNPLGDPYVIGVTPGATLGAVAAIVSAAGLGAAGVSFAAFGGALLAFAAVLLLARRGPGGAGAGVVLAGVAIGYLLTAGTYFLQVMATPTQLQQTLFWTLGSVAGVGWTTLPLLALVTVVGCGWLLVRARMLDSLAGGPELARSQGIPVARFQVELMVVAAVMTGCVVAVVGGIGFVGLVVPHIARLLVGATHRVLLVGALLVGATFLPAADIVARTVLAPAEMPIGIVTAAVGAPLFIVQLLRSGRGGTA